MTNDGALVSADEESVLFEDCRSEHQGQGDGPLLETSLE